MSDQADTGAPGAMASGMPARMMRAILLIATGGPEQLQAGELARPVPAADEVLIRVATVSAGRQDLLAIGGTANIAGMSLPLVLGNDPAGTVVEVGAAVADLAAGDRVVVKPQIGCGICPACASGEDDSCLSLRSVGLHRQGGFAEYVAVPARNVFRIPDGLAFAEATALAQSFPIALQMLRERGGVGAGDTVLVTSAAGAIGSAAVQVARILGARVISAAGGEAHVAFARTLGAEEVIDYRAEPAFGRLVRERFPAGTSVYVESAGRPAVWNEAVSTMGRRGRILVCGAHGGPVVDLNLSWLFRNRVSIIGSAGARRSVFADAVQLATDQLAAGRPLVANIDSIRPLAEARSAFERLGAGHNRGKIILDVTGG